MTRKFYMLDPRDGTYLGWVNDESGTMAEGPSLTLTAIPEGPTQPGIVWMFSGGAWIPHQADKGRS